MLGERVSDRVLLAQARDFLAMDEETMDRTIERFNRTETLYAAKGEKEEEKDEGEDKKEETPAVSDAAPAPAAPMPEPVALPKAPAPVVAGEMTFEPMTAAKNEEEEEEEEEKPKACKASKARALNIARLAARTLPVNECTRENIAKRAEKFASMSDEAVRLALVAAGEQPVVDEEAAKAKKDDTCPPCPPCPPVAPAAPAQPAAPVASVNESQFDLNEEFNDGPVAADAAADAELAAVFGDPMDSVSMNMPIASINSEIADAAEQSGRKRSASKVGVRSVGGAVVAPAQQVTASDDLSSLWKDAPDVNSFFSNIQSQSRFTLVGILSMAIEAIL
jgi:hypothetical protein